MIFTYDGLTGAAAEVAKARDEQEFGEAFVIERRAVVPVDIEIRRELWRRARQYIASEKALKADEQARKAKIEADRQRNIEKFGMAYGTYPIEKIEIITEMRENGMLEKDIAAAWGVTAGTIGAFCIRWGIPKFDAQSPAYRRAKSGVNP